MTQWQIFTEFSRKFTENLTLLLVQNAQLSTFATAHAARPLPEHFKFKTNGLDCKSVTVFWVF